MTPVRVLEKRAGVLECEHRVRVAVWRDGATVAERGDADEPVYLRSSAKPVQALASFATGAADRFAMTDAEIALACGSHGGEPFHTETAAGLLEKIGRTPEDLQCGVHPPAYEPAARALWAAGQSPTVLHNNCSGKHSAMLAACVAAGWDVADYLALDHPLQKMNRDHVAALAGLAPGDVRVGVDGCSAPVFAIPLAAAARLFAGIANRECVDVPEVKRVALRRIAAAVRERPEMIGGTKRLDTDLSRATGGRILSKVGAEGLWCIGVAGERLGVAVKCESGAAAPAHLAGLAALRRLGVLSDAEWDALAPHRDLVRRNHRRIEVGLTEIEPPGAIN